MKNILFINHTNLMAGAETVLLAGIKALITKENMNTIYVLLPKEKKKSLFKDALTNIGVSHCFSLPYSYLGGSLWRSIGVLIFNFYSIIILVHFIKKKRIDILYSNTSITCIGIIAAILTKKPHIWHIHESVQFEDLFKDIRLRYIYNYLIGYKNNTTVFISNTQRREWEAYIGNAIENHIVIYNPVKKMQKRCTNHNDRVVYGYLGSFSKRKNVPLLISTFYELHKTMPNTMLLIGGDGEQRGMIEDMIKEYALENSITLLGYVSDVSAFYSNIDVFVLPSFCETWELVTIEAMLLRIAVITTIHTGLTELFEHKKDCIFIDPLNKLELLEAMKSLADFEARETLAATGYRKISSYNFNTAFEKSFRALFSYGAD